MKGPLPPTSKGKKKKRDNPNARAVARDVVAHLLRGERVIMKDILIKHGYSENTAKQVSPVTRQPSYKEEISTYTDRLRRHRMSVIEAMEKKNLDEEQYRTLSDASAKLTHDIQLLSGGKTENLGVSDDHSTVVAILAAVRGQPVELPPIHEDVIPRTLPEHDTGGETESESAAETI